MLLINKDKQLKKEGQKLVEALKVLDPEQNQKLKSVEELLSEKIRNDEIKNEIYEIKELKNETKIFKMRNK